MSSVIACSVVETLAADWLAASVAEKSAKARKEQLAKALLACTAPGPIVPGVAHIAAQGDSLTPDTDAMVRFLQDRAIAVPMKPRTGARAHLRTS